MVPNVNVLLKLLSNHDVTFFIPPYQRNYEWEEEQCKIFFEDVYKTAKTNYSGIKTEHFFGSVTFFRDLTAPYGQPDKLILIDGQQRITTTMLFLVAIRDTIDNLEFKNRLENDYLKNSKVSGDSEYKIKLKQVENDWETYKNIIFGEEIVDNEKNSAIYRNYIYFKNRLLSLNKSGYNLTDLVQYGLENFSIVTLELQPSINTWENPQEIFESMNSIGKPLSLADLIRNYLMLGLSAEEQEKLYKQYWLKIEKRLSRNISFFIRDYMQYTEQKAFKQAKESNYKELYSQFKEVYANENTKDLLTNLEKFSVYYSMLIDDISTGNKYIDEVLFDLKYLNVTTAYSFFMALIYEWKNNRFSDNDLLDILVVFNIYCLRRRLIGLSGAENKAFPTLVKRIPELVKATNKKEAMFRIVSTQENSLRLPNNIETKRQLESMNFYNFKYCKYFLALVEEKLTKNRPDISNDKLLQIEHIMPQTLNNVWRSELGEDCDRIHQELVNSIGNLTLIRHNQELSNKAFNEKLDIYKNNAGLQIAKSEITNQILWNEQTIKNRSDWIINYLLNSIIPIPKEMEGNNNFVSKEGRMSFENLGLINQKINFIKDKNIKVLVLNDTQVEFEGKVWLLSPLTKEIYERMGKTTKSGTYRGADHWEFDGTKISNLI